MKQYIFSILGVCLAFSMQAQIELGTHFMSNVAQNNLLNPAAFTDNGYKVNVSLLPSIYAGFNNSAIAPDDVLEKRGTSLYLDVEGLIEKTINFLSFNNQVFFLCFKTIIFNRKYIVTTG